jgi:cap1 methyltransferase
MYIINDFLFSLNATEIVMNYSDSTVEHLTINPSLKEEVCNIKQEIEKYIHKWEDYKKITNKYEYINSVFFLEKQKINSCVCSYKPISRSYFKMIEILTQFKFNFPFAIHSFHLAEGPGGFIEAICYLRSNIKDKYYGMTLIDNNPDVPGWKKSDDILNMYPNIYIEYGADNTGDLFNICNLEYCSKKYKNKMHLITADGGFDFSIDFNKQEEIGFNLIFAQVCYALTMQKHNGHFILKIFDSFTKPTVDLIYILNTLYSKVYIMKPDTSRHANSEKYIVCKHFKYKECDEVVKHLVKDFHKIKTKNITNILSIYKPSHFLNKLIEYNSIFGQQQIENISNTLSLINNEIDGEKINALKKTNVYKCIKWCKKHKLPFNNISI